MHAQRPLSPPFSLLAPAPDGKHVNLSLAHGNGPTGTGPQDQLASPHMGPAKLLAQPLVPVGSMVDQDPEGTNRLWRWMHLNAAAHAICI